MPLTPDTAPPLPPQGGGPGAPSYASLTGGPPQAANPAQSTTPGSSQIGGAAVRMGMEIDQALKLLAQAVPQLAPWVDKVTQDLRVQLGQALSAGSVPSSPSTADSKSMPMGGGNLQ